MGMGNLTRPTRSYSRRLLTLLALLALAVGIGLFAGGAFAVHDENLIELESDGGANITDEGGPAVGGHDWIDFQTSPIAGQLDTVFIADGFAGTNDDTYTGGGSQNNNDISSWAWE